MKIRPPKENEMKGTYDPNYQTLAGLNNDDVFKPKVCCNRIHFSTVRILRLNLLKLR